MRKEEIYSVGVIPMVCLSTLIKVVRLWKPHSSGSVSGKECIIIYEQLDDLDMRSKAPIATPRFHLKSVFCRLNY
jgi:hypothetical protein